nr:hypothetical protein [Kibdelosporangium sp. MJ126-NF4]
MQHQRHGVLVDRQLGQHLVREIRHPPEQRLRAPCRREQNQLAPVDAQQRAISPCVVRGRGQVVKARISDHDSVLCGRRTHALELDTLVVMGQRDDCGNHPAVVVDQPCGVHSGHDTRTGVVLLEAEAVGNQQHGRVELSQPVVLARRHRQVERGRAGLTPRQDVCPEVSECVLNTGAEDGGVLVVDSEEHLDPTVVLQQRQDIEKTGERGDSPDDGENSATGRNSQPMARQAKASGLPGHWRACRASGLPGFRASGLPGVMIPNCTASAVQRRRPSVRGVQRRRHWLRAYVARAMRRGVVRGVSLPYGLGAAIPRRVGRSAYETQPQAQAVPISRHVVVSFGRSYGRGAPRPNAT